MALIRVSMVDVPWHLATGRLVVEDGILPTTNTFSWTNPEFTLYQQYPLFQVPLFLVWKLAGFEGLSFLTAVLWVAVAMVWLRWGGSWADAARLAPLWLIAMIGVQRHLLLRPDVLSVLLLGLLVRSIDRFRSDPRWRWVAAAVLVQWIWVNSHQLFVIGFAVQLAFLIHLLLSRARPNSALFSSVDKRVSMLKPTAMLGASVIVSALSPLGFRTLSIPIRSLTTLSTRGASAGVAQADELLPVWSDTVASVVVVVGLLILVAAAFRGRGHWLWFELAMIALGTGLVLAAQRGIVFFALLVYGVAARWLAYRRPERSRSSLDYASYAVVTVSIVFAVARIDAAPSLLAVQDGVGRAVGEWPDETIAYLNSNKPDGDMLNIGWASGNVLIWEGYEVFVDPRWESYPAEFLNDAIAAIADADVLNRQIEEWQPSWIVAELRLPEVQKRMAELVASAEWGVVHLDTLHLVLVRGATNEATIEAVGWHPSVPTLFAEEKARVACWYDYQGMQPRADELRSEAMDISPFVADYVASFSDCRIDT